MAAPNRAAILKKAHTVLKRHYKPVKPLAERSVLETILYACCLENAHYQKADDAFARLQELFYDWNEVRVTTVTELADVMAGLPNPRQSAANLKRCLQNLFEAYYSFDLDSLRKDNIGAAEKKLQKCGASGFVVAYVVQNGLSGHAIPVDQGASDVLTITGAITEAEAEKNQAPGLERAIPKSKGVEFGSLLHQLAADLIASPHGTKVRKVLLEIAPDAKDRLPKRGGKKETKETSKPKKAAAKKKATKEKPAKKSSASKKTAASAGAKKKVAKKAKAAPKQKTAKKPAKKKTVAKKTTKKAAKKKPAKGTTGKKKSTKKPAKKGKSATKRITRKKPR